MPTINTCDDYSLYYEDHGTGSDTIVFVHEFGGDYRSWYKQIAFFEPNFRCITYCARGFYPSSIPVEQADYGQDQATSDLLDLIQKMDVGSVHLVGTSMGSFTCLDFALNHSVHVESLTLVGNSSGPRDANERKKYISNWVKPEMRQREIHNNEGGVLILTEDPAYTNFQQIDTVGWQRYAQNLREQSVSGAVNILKTLHWNRRSLWQDQGRLMQLNIPVLLVYGDQDYFLVGKTNNFLHEILPNSRLHCFDTTGHLVNIERAEEFNVLLDDFLSTNQIK